jgi:hypothetical protein
VSVYTAFCRTGLSTCPNLEPPSILLHQCCYIGNSPSTHSFLQTPSFAISGFKFRRLTSDCPGDEDVQARLISLCNEYKPKKYWSKHKTDLNDIVAGTRTISLPPPQDLSNPGQGRDNCWQLNESAQDFVRRVPPLTTPSTSCDWIWVHNPHSRICDASNTAEFASRGPALLEQSLQIRNEIQAQSALRANTTTSQLLNQESRLLQQRIADLAAETKVLTGKVSPKAPAQLNQAKISLQWMLFPELPDLSRIWRLAVDGVINNRLGPTAKVAPDDGADRARLICIYTKDFRDKEDILRVLQELVSLGFAGAGKSIYYKSDAYTHLDISGKTAAGYGLQASLYSSHKMLADASRAKTGPAPQKKQSTLNGFLRSHNPMDLD